MPWCAPDAQQLSHCLANGWSNTRVAGQYPAHTDELFPLTPYPHMGRTLHCWDTSVADARSFVSNSCHIHRDNSNGSQSAAKDGMLRPFGSLEILRDEHCATTIRWWQWCGHRQEVCHDAEVV
jgi:hypothetical protein